MELEQLNTREALLEAVRGLRADLERDIAEAGEARMEQPGSFDGWTFKDVIVHLTGWRLVTAARLEAGWHGGEPTYPWPDHLDEEHDTDEINQWFYEAGRDKSVAQVLAESRATFDRVERAIAEMPDDALFKPGYVDWLDWTAAGLGPAVVEGTWGHYHEEHEPLIRAWLARG